MEKAWEVVHKPFLKLRLQSGQQLGGESLRGQPGVILASHCWVCVSACGGNSCLGVLSSLCTLYRCAVLQLEQDKPVTMIYPCSVSIDTFGGLIGIAFKMLLYYEYLPWLITKQLNT